ncbi:hypothetical protein ASF58_01815 [Methylobacterium sp. Leaf125]|jgi:hypothetical protein|nr:hypothetical protein ASF58_01815 [Methylobacterium sp. Leaf125]POR43739.1 hypothetical protein CRT23_05645 [Methylobacterium sp. V23]RZK93366.1 MAG: hypothetical protein EOO66_10195 [Methylobacterium sp.]
MEAEMRSVTTLAVAFVIAAAAFTITMLTKPPVSEARAISRIDTYALTLGAHPADAQSYDCQ